MTSSGYPYDVDNRSTQAPHSEPHGTAAGARTVEPWGVTGERYDWRDGAVIHLDLDAFFAAVEQLDNPELRGRPVIVGGDPEGRSVVSTASYEARVFGVHSAMSSAQAQQLCPDGIWVYPRFHRYRELSDQVFDIVRRHTPDVAVRSIDEAYADVRPGRFTGDDPVQVALAIQHEVETLGLTCSIGLSASPIVSKIASDYRKPRGITVIPPGCEQAFLSPMPIQRMPGIGRVMGERMRSEHFTTLGQLAALAPEDAADRWGSFAADVVRAARGEKRSHWNMDDDGVKSVSNERTFPEDVVNGEPLERELLALSERVAWRLRKQGLKGRTISIKLVQNWGSARSVSRTVDTPTDSERVIGAVAIELLHTMTAPPDAVRLAGVRMANFDVVEIQRPLFDHVQGSPSGVEDPRSDATPTDVVEVTTNDADDSKSAALDAIREKYGYGAIVSGASLRSNAKH